MATAEETLVSVLEAAAAVKTLTGDENRIYPQILPQKPDLPAITHTRIGGAPVSSFDGQDGLDNGLYQLDCWAETAKAARQLADAVAAAIDDAAALGSTLESVVNDYEEDTRLYRVSMDFSFWHADS